MTDERVERTGDLISQARAGRREAFEALFDEQRPALERALRRRMTPAVQRRLDVSDVVQESLVDAYRGLGSFEYRGIGSFRAWLRRVAENRLKMMLGHAARAKRDRARETLLGSRLDPVAEQATSPSGAAQRGERRALVRAALATLSEDHREVVRCVRLEGCSIAETARRMGRSENAVKKLLARALLELGRALPPGAAQ